MADPMTIRPSGGPRLVAGLVVAAIVVAAGVGLHATRTVEHKITQTENAAQGRLEKLERLGLDAAGFGAPAAKAVADIREILRPGTPEIDTLPAEQLLKVMPRIIADLQKPAATPEAFAGPIKRALEQAQAQAGAFKFVDAAKTLDEAIAAAETERAKAATGSQTKARDVAALLAERGRVAGLQLRYRKSAEFYAKAAETTAFDPELSWAYSLEAARALYDQGDMFKDTAALSESVQSYRSALNLVPRERAPLDWAGTQNNLGLALAKLGERETTGAARLREAVTAFRDALKVLSRERVPLDWATTQNNLGNALESLGERESETTTLQQAAAAYSEALKEYTRQRVPLQWAMTQNSLGNALLALGERDNRMATLQQAVAAYRETLKEYTRERVPPLDWAMTENNLGEALRELGERESETATLQDSVAAYGEALKERTRERVPLDWAMSYGNQGVALMRLAERTKDSAMAKAAVAQISAAYETMRADGPAPRAAYFKARLPEARAISQRLSGPVSVETVSRKRR